jgi:hypothetical protein
MIVQNYDGIVQDLTPLFSTHGTYACSNDPIPESINSHIEKENDDAQPERDVADDLELEGF